MPSQSQNAWSLALVLALACARTASAAPPPEDHIKAEFVERFTRFVEWPEGTFSMERAPFVVCVAGEAPLFGRLQTIVEERGMRGRPAVLRTETGTTVEGCHLLFLGLLDDRRLSSILERAAGSPILTVGDTPGYAEQGIHINLFVRERRIQFEINAAAASKSGLRVSSKLLKLGRAVQGGGPP